jgi:hypothetical protein
MTAHLKWCHDTGAVVRKPSEKETAMRDTRERAGLYWDLIDGCDPRILTAKTVDRDHNFWVLA